MIDNITDHTLVTFQTPIPTYWIGPVKINGQYATGEYMVPLATAEKPIAYSVSRGCRATYENGIDTIVRDNGCSRAPVIESKSAKEMLSVENFVRAQFFELKNAVDRTTNYGKLQDITLHPVGRQAYLRVRISTGDAAGHNMVAKAAYAVVSKIQENFPDVKLISLSGNYCVDKKVSSINSISGRGKYVIAETTVPGDICRRILHTTPQRIVKLNQLKNHQGSIVAGSLCSANAHYANILAAMYLATGQDVANIVEGSQGITAAELEGNDLYFSVTIPNIIVGTVGGGTKLLVQEENLKKLGCKDADSRLGHNPKKLSEIIAATVLTGELNLLAVLSNEDELVKSHERIERC